MTKNRRSMMHLMLLALAGGLWAVDEPWPAGMKDLVATEKRFAATCAEKGIRDSFLMFFADDVVTFSRGLQLGKDYLRERTPADPMRFRLQWVPVYGDISRAGDLGYLTGPYSLEDSKGESPAQRGYYFSVWTKKEGDWKVAVDFGVQSPTAEFRPDAPFELAPQDQHVESTTAAMRSASDQLAQTEAALIERAASVGLGAAVCEVAAPSIRYYRDGEPPRQGIDSVCGESVRTGERHQFKMRNSTVARSGDLGFSYGDYNLIASPPEQAAQGAYVRVWKRNGDDKWRLVVAVDKSVKR